MLEESSVYQDIFQKGIKIGVQEGMQNIIIRLLVRRCDKLSLNLHKQIKSLSLKQLEQLSEDLLDFKTKNDLTVWLNKNASAH